MDRQTLRDWVHRYNGEGLAGLVNRKAPGRRRYLDDEQRAELARLVEAGPAPDQDGVVRWRRIDLKGKIEDIFGVRMHERTVGKQLVALGFTKMTVRPQHPKADVEAQEAFKKTSRTGSVRCCPKQPRARPSRSGSKMKRGWGSRAR